MTARSTLHDELQAILLSGGNVWMTTTELADAVNQRGPYVKDGSLVDAFQVHGRTRNYPHLFERERSSVRLRAHDADWLLAPGESIRRIDLHELYGGRRQGGIGPSASTPNVLVRSAPTTALRWRGEANWFGSCPDPNRPQSVSGGKPFLTRHSLILGRKAAAICTATSSSCSSVMPSVGMRMASSGTADAGWVGSFLAIMARVSDTVGEGAEIARRTGPIRG